MINNFVCQLVAGAGTNSATINLGSTVTGYADFKSVFSVGDKVFYTLIDGNDKETGVGVLNNGSLTRTKVFMRIRSGVLTKNPTTFLSYSSTAYLASMNSVEALTYTTPVWVKENVELRSAGVTGALFKGLLTLSLSHDSDVLLGQFNLPNNVLIGSDVYLELLVHNSGSDTEQIVLLTEFAKVTPDVVQQEVFTDTTMYNFEYGGDETPEVIQIYLGTVESDNETYLFNIRRDFENGLDTADRDINLLSARLCYQINKQGTLDISGNTWE